MPAEKPHSSGLSALFEEYYAELMEASKVGLSDVLRREVWATVCADPSLDPQRSEVVAAVDAELKRRGALIEESAKS